MRLITRSDFDGLACAVFLREAGIIDTWKFVHPKDLQDGVFEITEDDCLANVPFVEGCGLWFDHHSSEQERIKNNWDYKGASDPSSPSAAHVIFDYYGGEKTFPTLIEMLHAVDKIDSGNLTHEEVLQPTDWVLLGFIMDPRTGLGRFRNFKIPNYRLMEELIIWCTHKQIDEIMALEDIRERVEVYVEQSNLFKEMLQKHSIVEDQVIITDLRNVETIYTGNRFMIYSLFPDQNISIWIVSGKDGIGCSAAVGHSILNRTSKVDVGTLMLKYGGGGHEKVGTCQFTDEDMKNKLDVLIGEVKTLNL